MANKFAEEHAKYLADGEIRRQGQRQVFESRRGPLAQMARTHVFVYVRANAKALGFKPWEFVHNYNLVQALSDHGILAYFDEKGRRQARGNFVVRAEIDVPRMKRFIAQNINRFKLNLSERAREEDEMYAEAEEAVDALD